MKWFIIKTGIFALALSGCATSVAGPDYDSFDREFAGGAELGDGEEDGDHAGGMGDFQRYSVQRHNSQASTEPAARPGPVPWIEGSPAPPESGNSSNGGGSSKP